MIHGQSDYYRSFVVGSTTLERYITDSRISAMIGGNQIVCGTSFRPSQTFKGSYYYFLFRLGERRGFDRIDVDCIGTYKFKMFRCSWLALFVSFLSSIFCDIFPLTGSLNRCSCNVLPSYKMSPETGAFVFNSRTPPGYLLSLRNRQKTYHDNVAKIILFFKLFF